MIRTSLLISALALAGWTGGGTWYWVCQVRSLCGGTSSAPAAPQPAAPAGVPPLTVTYRDQVLLQAPDNLRYGRADSAGRKPAPVQQLLDSLADYMQAHPDLDLEITGGFALGEAPGDAGPRNLGLIRAGVLQQWLMRQGIAENRFIRSYQVLPDSEFRQDSLAGGMALRLVDPVRALPMPADSASGTPAEPATRFESRDCYFALGSPLLTLDEDLRRYITASIQILRADSSRTLVLTGHTDNSGGAARNRVLSLERAGTVKRYFVEFGLPASRIRTVGRSSFEPIAPNTTEAGRAKNRRVEVRVE
jgi:OOP family OmpA-OmpF porin